ncbi:MAG: hypothetical protein M1838_004156 [Thelocarpon superellum]|nr:MAG: hypothetical protein M1838_004156 [Thelocarpon superellum]
MAIDLTVFKGSKGGKVVKSVAHRDGLKGDEVLVKMTHSGVCGTDLHYRGADMVLGHEGAGVVQELGPEVVDFQVGDRVGFGYLHQTCGHCQQCLLGNEVFCPERHMYGGAETDKGSFGSHMVWRAAYLFHIPDAIKSEDAAPLMCGGATVFNVLHTFGVQPTDRIGIIGVGGLGHLAIQFAAKMGCEVVVFSGTDSKKEQALQLGASEFYATKDATELKIGKPVNHLIVTTSAQPDWKLYIPTLAANAGIFPLSVSRENFVMPYGALLMQGLRVQGSLVASRGVHNKMLRFAAVHGIKPIIQTFPMNVQGIEECIETLDQGRMRYRGVLVVEDEEKVMNGQEAIPAYAETPVNGHKAPTNGGESSSNAPATNSVEPSTNGLETSNTAPETSTNGQETAEAGQGASVGSPRL